MTGGFGLRISWLLVDRVSAAAHEASCGPLIRTAGTNLWANRAHYCKLYEENWLHKLKKLVDCFLSGNDVNCEEERIEEVSKFGSYGQASTCLLRWRATHARASVLNKARIDAMARTYTCKLSIEFVYNQLNYV